jgi:hypothetical protein
MERVDGGDREWLGKGVQLDTRKEWSKRSGNIGVLSLERDRKNAKILWASSEADIKGVRNHQPFNPQGEAHDRQTVLFFKIFEMEGVRFAMTADQDAAVKCCRCWALSGVTRLRQRAGE